MTVFKNIAAVLLGLILGGAANMVIVIVGPMIIPPPVGVDVSDAESIRASIHLFEARHFVAPFVAHAIGTMIGAAVAYGIAASHKIAIAYVIGAAFLAGGIAASFMIPAPVWFVVLDLFVAYVPMAWIGIQIGRRFTHSVQTVS